MNKDDERKKTCEERNLEQEEGYMRLALQVAEAALQVGEVPVGCIIVLRNARGDNEIDDSVIISHGANQVNATRDATRHAEMVAIDRMLTGGLSSDRQCLAPEIIAKSAHGAIPEHSPLLSNEKRNLAQDKWVNVADDPLHWKNSYGWGSGRRFGKEIFAQCDLYVTCEPCIMCAAALAKVGIGRVYFGCKNDRFGGCGSLLHLHKAETLPGDSHRGYPIYSSILEKEAIALLRSFYNRENFHAPDDKRKRKEGKSDLGPTS